MFLCFYTFIYTIIILCIYAKILLYFYSKYFYAFAHLNICIFA